jgi:2-oxo-3-hexenedioate decarboxylase/2-keto-4-pentenoate hydratase
VGATAPGAPARLGLSKPFIGPLFASAVILSDGEAFVRLPAAHGVQAEVEVAFRFAAPVPAGAGAADLLAAVDAVAVGLEFPASRWTRPADPPGPGFIADHAGNGALVVGPFRKDWRDMDLAAATARLLVAGEERGRNTGANVMGGPVNALVHFATELWARGGRIEPGLLVTSGGIVGPLDVAEGPVTAEVEGLAPVVCNVRAEHP